MKQTLLRAWPLTRMMPKCWKQAHIFLASCQKNFFLILREHWYRNTAMLIALSSLVPISLNFVPEGHIDNIWTNVDPIYWHTHAAPRVDELTCVSQETLISLAKHNIHTFCSFVSWLKPNQSLKLSDWQPLVQPMMMKLSVLQPFNFNDEQSYILSMCW